MIKYKIFKKVNRELNIEEDNKRKYSSLTGKIQYYAKRKGRIFKFWNHNVGIENCDYNGDTYIPIEYFEYKSDCREFIKNFHYWKYGIETPYKIVN